MIHSLSARWPDSVSSNMMSSLRFGQLRITLALERGNYVSR